ncbi:response regulator transcription factor [Lysobacter sp. GCM10012299]|uniref:response regulator transcription factor n=1 Tax=Lysobacter sp. GCM10012299 TaxID=3317333 RepID=UPI00360A6418
MKRAPMIAILDDDEGVRTSLSSLVRSLGHDVRTYSSATQFLADVDAGDPDCLITDMQMPGMTGAQLLDALVVNARRFPVIVMTAFPSDAVRERVLAAGALAYLVKPMDGPTVTRCIAAALDGGSPEADPYTLV